MFTFLLIRSILLLLLSHIHIFLFSSGVGRNLKEMSFTRRKNEDHFNLKLPTLIIATFILCNVCPNFLGIFIKNSPEDGLSIELVISHLMYLLGWIADPLLYVCTQRTKTRSKSTRKTLEKLVKFSRVNNEDTRATSVIL